MDPWAQLTRVIHPNGISIGSAVSAGLMNVFQQTDRYTDRPHYSVCSNRLHLAITA